MPTVFETRLVFNTKGNKAKRRLRHGRPHLVTNGVLLKEGVHTGSYGPVYYPPDFIKKMLGKGVGKPIVLNHPLEDGRPVSVNNGEFLTVAGLGELGELAGESEMRAEMWFDEERTKKASPAVHNALVAGEPLEVSTGFELIVNEVAGENGGERYKAVADDGEFDHLAIITNGKGACDLKKGCGCNITVNCDCVTVGGHTLPKAVYDELLTEAKRLVSNKETKVDKATEYVNTLVANKDSGFDESDREFLTKKGEEWLKARVDGLTPKQPERKPDPPMIEPKKQVTLNEYIEQAPAEVREMLGESLTALQTEKDQLVKTIVANRSNVFSADWLKTLPLPQLRGMARLSGGEQRQPVNNYAGAAAGVFTDNSAAAEEEPLVAKRPEFKRK